MVNRIGLYNENFQMTEAELDQVVESEVRGRTASFHVTAGPMKWNGQVFDETYVMEVAFYEEEKAHAASLPAGGFNSMLCYDYMDATAEVVKSVAEEHGFSLSTHLNSWPVYQIVIQRQDTPPLKTGTDAEY